MLDTIYAGLTDLPGAVVREHGVGIDDQGRDGFFADVTFGEWDLQLSFDLRPAGWSLEANIFTHPAGLRVEKVSNQRGISDALVHDAIRVVVRHGLTRLAYHRTRRSRGYPI